MNTTDLQTDNINCLNILDKITRVHKHKQVNEGDIVEWVAECETDYLQDIDHMIGYIGIGLFVRNGRAKLPCNVYRIFSVYTRRGDRGSQVRFRKVGQWLYFDQPCKFHTVYIDFAGIRVDEAGYPVVNPAHLQALEAFCVYKLYYEDFILQKISGMAWGEIKEDMINKCRETAYDFRDMTLEDFNHLHFIQYNMVPKIGGMQLSQDDVNVHFIMQ